MTTNQARTTFSGLLSLKDVKLDNFKVVYPNPTSSNINIQTSLVIKSLEVYDMQGRLLDTIIGNKKSFDFSGKSNGVYFLKINTDSGSMMEKVIKQ